MILPYFGDHPDRRSPDPSALFFELFFFRRPDAGGRTQCFGSRTSEDRARAMEAHTGDFSSTTCDRAAFDALANPTRQPQANRVVNPFNITRSYYSSDLISLSIPFDEARYALRARRLARSTGDRDAGIGPSS
jgi:hypothetical protein